MINFDFKSFFDAYGIFYTDKGSNVASGNINIKCPFCGNADPSEHLGVNLSTGRWGCWRDSTHRGLSPQRLVRQALNCSWDKALSIVGEGKSYPAIELSDLRKRLGEQAEDLVVQVPHAEEVAMPKSFYTILSPDGYYERFGEYLIRRGFEGDSIYDLTKRYNLMGSRLGKWRNRLIIPFVGESGKVYGWTGRAIGKNPIIRYVNYPEGGGKDQVFNAQYAAEGGKALVIVEGPLDCLRADYYGQELGVVAVAVMGTGVTATQLGQLVRLGSRFDRVVIMFDGEAESMALSLGSALSIVRPYTHFLGPGIDPASISISGLNKALRSFVAR